MVKNKKDFILSKQILRSGTSIEAMDITFKTALRSRKKMMKRACFRARKNRRYTRSTLRIFLSENTRFAIFSVLWSAVSKCDVHNVEEAVGGQSRKDFLNEISIAYKEARETGYWLRLLKDSSILSESHFFSIYQDLEEIIKILTKIQKTIKNSK